MLNNINILDIYHMAFAKQSKLLQNCNFFVEFLNSWYRIKEYINENFKYIKENNFYSKSLDKLPKFEKKIIFKVVRTFKKLKYRDDPFIAKKASIMALQNK